MKDDNSVVEVKSASFQGVSLSDEAKKHINAQLSKRGKGVGVRLSVDKTGCSGLAYVFDYVDAPKDEDKHFNVEGVNVYVDRKSYPYLKGLSIDFVKQGVNHKFTFKNPNQTGECGCGESFTVSELPTDES